MEQFHLNNNVLFIKMIVTLSIIQIGIKMLFFKVTIPVRLGREREFSYFECIFSLSAGMGWHFDLGCILLG
jgi:hypothetical protein